MNEAGYEGIIPRFAGGDPIITDEEISRLKERDDWTNKEIRKLICD